jgi:hypothetical protein
LEVHGLLTVSVVRHIREAPKVRVQNWSAAVTSITGSEKQPDVGALGVMGDQLTDLRVAQPLIRLRLPGQNSVHRDTLVKGMVALFSPERHEQDELARLMFHDAGQAPGPSTRSEIGSRREDVAHFPSAIVIEQAQRVYRPRGRLGNNNRESERLEASAYGRIATSEVRRWKWTQFGMLVPVRGARDRFGIVAAPVSQQKVAARPAESVFR